MERPYVNLNSENMIQKMLEAFNKSLDIFTALDGVVGITLNGGLSRGYGDYLSEIDVVIYLQEHRFMEYKNGLYPFALGITRIDGYLYDIKTANIERELERDYEPVALWDLSYAKIMYDPQSKLADFIKQKLSKTVDISQAGGLLWSAYWSYKLSGNIWIHRQDAVQGHFTLNNAINPLIGALFIANNEYIPHEKWLVHMSKSLSWTPEHWSERLKDAMNTGDFSFQSLVDRQNCIDDLWHEINRRLCDLSGFYSKLDFVQKGNYETLNRLVQKSEYTLAEWEAVSDLDSLNYEPIHSLFKRTGDMIIFSKSALLSLNPEDMYIWMYEIADEVKRDMLS